MGGKIAYNKVRKGGENVSDRERVIQLLNNLPDSKIAYVIGYIQGLTVEENGIEEVEPDEWDLKMIEEAKQENDGETVSFEELLKKEGLTYADLRG